MFLIGEGIANVRKFDIGGSTRVRPCMNNLYYFGALDVSCSVSTLNAVLDSNRIERFITERQLTCVRIIK